MSTPSERPNFRSSTSFGVIADVGSGTPGRVDPLVLADLAAVDDRRLNLAAGRSSRRAARRGRRRAAAGRRCATLCASPSNVVDSRPGPPTPSPVAIDDAVAGLELNRAAAGEPRRCGSSDRRDPGGSRPRSRRAWTPRGCARTSRACDSCVPCEKFRRKMSVPAAMSASSVASESLGRARRWR